MQLKHAVEWTLVAAGTPRLLCAAARRSTLILAYHNIVPDGPPAAGDPSLHLLQSRFAQQLDLLSETHDVVPLTAVFERTSSTRPRAVITFDDAYRGAVRYGVEELARRELPATIFVAPAYIPSADFWWDALQDEEGRAPSMAFRAQALEQWQGRDTVIREHAASAGLHAVAVPEVARAATEAELVGALQRHPGLTLGSHSWSHVNLARVGGTTLDHELQASLKWLQSLTDRAVPWLAYPYGCSSSVAAAAAARAGYTGALEILGGRFHATHSNPYALPRLNIPAGLSRNGFVLRLAGVRAR